MQVGVHFNYQNFSDWERFEAHQPGSPRVADQQIYEEELHLGALVVLRLALSQEWFSYDGQFYQIPETTIRPRPRSPRQLLDRMRVAWTSPPTLPIAANNGLGMLMTNQKSWEEYRDDVRGFNAVPAE